MIWLAIGQLLLLGAGLVAGLWAGARNTRHLQAVLIRHGTIVAEERAQHTATLLEAFEAQRLLLQQLLVTRPPPLGAIVLVVDDEADDRELARIRLVRAGYRVRLVESAEAALTSLSREGFPDLILLDLALRQMPGLTLITELRAVGYTHPVIAHSGSGIGEAAARAAGCNGFLEKTHDDWTFLRAVAHHLEEGTH